MKHKVGDVVKVREDLKEGRKIRNFYVAPDMVKFAGKLVTINSVNDDDDYHIGEDGQTYFWIDDFFEDDDEDCDVDKILKEEEKSDEYEDIIEEVLSEMTEENKDILIKEIIKGENNIAIIATPIYKMMSYINGVSIQKIIGTKYGVAITNKEGTIKL